MKTVLINIQGLHFHTKEAAKEYYGSKFEHAILQKAIIDEDGEVLEYLD